MFANQSAKKQRPAKSSDSKKQKKVPLSMT